MRSLALLALCGCTSELPPFGEVLLIVDTDAPVPQVVSRLRIDVHAGDGTWLESHDIARPDVRDWPVSFSVYTEDEERDVDVWVRLRAYPEGGVRDYSGERFTGWGGPLVEPPPGDGEPRLLLDGRDITPATEPAPLLTVDQLALVRLEPGKRGRTLVTLRAACAGTMADMAARESCTEVEKERDTVRAAAVEIDNLARPSASASTTSQPCRGDGPPDTVCIPGGPAIFGSAELTIFPDLPATPERIVLHRPFFVDRLEVTVARFRAALAAGFVPSEMPGERNAPLGSTLNETCSYSETDLGREGFGLSCVSFHTARELCQWSGGDLPSEAQFERMATLASDRGRSRYPWGDEPPGCDRASYGRLPLAGFPGVCAGFGPEPIDPLDARDVTRQGVIGLGGGLGEWMIDSYADYRSACWGDSPLTDARCLDESPTRALRGGSWAAPPVILASAVRLGIASDGTSPYVGFRCVYPGSP